MPRRDEDEENYEVDARCIRETDRALLVACDEGGKKAVERWIPKSVIHDDSEVYADGHVGKLVVNGWFARREGWL